MVARESSIATHEVIICTRNRPDELARCLEHVLGSTAIPRILVVDSSGPQHAAQLVEKAVAAHPHLEIRCIRTEPGLTVQRNHGLRASHADIVHFIDDDSYVTPTYFAEIMRAFASLGSRAVGVGGVQMNWPQRPPHPVRRAFGLAAGPGQVSRAGWNTYFYCRNGHEIQSVDWLSGCAMSFRRDHAIQTWFDESLAGYSLGEDLEFCLRVAEPGWLYVATRAHLEHQRSDRNRIDIRQYRAREIPFRASLVREHRTRFSSARFVVSLVGLILINLGRLPSRRQSSIDELRGILTGLRSIVVGSRVAGPP